MFDRSDEFYDAITRSHTMTETVQVLPDGGDPITLDVVGGDVTEDAGADIRHTASLEVVDPTGTLTPTTLGDLLMPGAGARIRVLRGIADVTDDPVPLATVYVTDARVSVDGDGRATIPLSCMDRAHRLQTPSVRPLAIPGGQPYTQAILRTLLTADPSLILDEAPVTAALNPRLVWESETDLWAEAQTMAAAIGCDLFVGRDDRLTIQPTPQIAPASEPVWRVAEGDDGRACCSAVLEAQTSNTFDGLPDGVVVVGQHSSMTSPVRGEAWSNPDRRGRARWIRTEKATTVAQAEAMAATVLATIGPALEVDVDVYPPPVHLVTGDVVHLDIPSVGATGRYLLWSMTTPLAKPSGPASCTFRRAVEDNP